MEGTSKKRTHRTQIEGHEAMNIFKLRPMWGLWQGPYPNAYCKRGLWVYADGCDTPARFVGVTRSGSVWLSYGESDGSRWRAPDFDESCKAFDSLAWA